MNRKIKLLLFLIFIYFLVSCIITHVNNRQKIVYIGSFTKIIINDKNIKVKYNNNKIINKKIKVYINNEFSDAYLNSFDADYYLEYKIFDNKNNNLQFTEDFIATTENVKINVINPSNTILSNKEINLVSENLDFSTKNIDRDSSFKYSFDIDGDGQNENIFVIFLNLEENKSEVYFILNKEDEFDIFESYKFDKMSPTLKIMSVFKYIDFNNDGIFEVVLKNNNGDDLPSQYNIYNFKNDNLIKIEE